MNTRLTTCLLLVALLGNLVACRELTAPGSSDQPGPIEILVLDENGDPLADREVLVSDLAFVPPGDDVEWRGRLSEDGRATVELPEGRYTVFVWNQGGRFSRWVEPAIDLHEGLSVLDPRLYLRTGRVVIPATLDPDRYRLELRATLTYGVRPVTFSFEAQIDPNGEFLAPWLDDMSYVVDLVRFPTRVRLHEDFVLAPSDSLRFEWTPEEFQIRLTLGGDPVPPSELRLTAATPGSNVATEFTPDGPVASYFGEAGFGRINIRSNWWLPFVEYEAPFEFRPGEIGQIELGDHRVELSLSTPEGQELYGCSVQASDANTSSFLSRTVDQARITLFLRPGQYRLEASRSGYERAELVVDIDGDSSFNLELEPTDAP